MIRFDIDGIGQIEMVGKGPWRTVDVAGMKEIRDSEGLVANPTVVQKFSISTKPNRGVIFAKAADTVRIVETANSLFAAAAPGTSAPVDGSKK